MAIDATAAAEAPGAPIRLNLIPYPKHVTTRGAPFRPTPSNFLFVSTNASVGTRRKCHILCKQLEHTGFRTQMEASSKLEPNQVIFTPSAMVPKWDMLERPLRGPAAGPEGYRLTVISEGILIHGADEAGVQYGGATLRQLLQDAPVPGCEIEDYPLLPFRMMHLDFKGWAPNIDYLRRTIHTLADLKINHLIIEYEAYFNFPSQPGLAGNGALMPTEVADLDLMAQDLGVTLVPLVPCLGNAGHVLRLPAYASLREHPNYVLQYCPVHVETVGVVTAMMEDLIAVHQGKYFHVGGDEARLLGSNPASEARARQLGGRAALYLDYIGKICRYLTGGGKTPLIWDEVIRKMTDDQVRWIPPEAVLMFRNFEGSSPRPSEALMTTLERYKQLGRKVWGVANRSPSSRFEAFDNIDAWTSAAEIGYTDGLMTAARTRDYSQGAMFAPPETAWPAAYYAAERAWGGTRAMPREEFPQRFMVRFFGTKDEGSQSRLWAGLDLLLRDHPRRAREFLASEFKNAARNRKTLAFLDSWAAINALKEYIKTFETEISNNFSNLQSGNADPFYAARLRYRVMDARAKAPHVIANFQQQAQRLTHDHIVQEYVEASIVYCLRRLDEMDTLLSSYPLPEAEWQQPVDL